MKTPKSNENEKNSAKKLVQARLPFKVITTTIADDIPKENSSPAQLKKRKLSDKDYDHDSITQKAEKEERQEKQEEKEECQHKKIKLLAEECVTVVLSDEEHDESSPTAKKLSAAIIKLPFSNKKSKRRKSATTTTTGEVGSSDDTEKLESAQKRPKVEPTVESKQQTDEQKIENNDEKPQIISDESSDCNTCSTSSSAEERDTTINMLTSDQKTADNNNELTTIENKVKKPLTKKQLDLMERRRQAREDKERKLNEEKMQKQKEKEEREEAKKREREEKEEQKRKEREEKEEKKRQEREEKERKRLEEIEAKNEEKRKRTEAKEEERKRKDLEKEEAELKAKKRAEAFTKFFVPKSETNELQDKVEKELTDQLACSPETKQNLAFRPFQVKGAMKLAPICRRQLTKNERESFEQCLEQKNADADNLYLKEIKMGKHLPLKYSKDVKETNSETGDDDEVFIVDELENDGQAILVESNVPVERMRVKFYKFTENRRPPYYGTWRKRSKFITPRKPFAQDTQTFDYEVDSDLEWEEEEPGESLEDSEADEKDKESEENDDYDVDNEWMVPHGHLSEEEMENEEEGVPLGDENTREAQKAKLQLLQQEFARDMNKKTKKIQPRLVGCIWVDLQGKQPETCSNIIWHSLNLRAMLCARPPVLEPQPEPEPEEKPTKSMLINESMSRELVRLIHGNSYSKNFLVSEFIAHIEVNDPAVKSGECQRPLKSTVRRKIEKYAEWQAVDDGENSSKKNKQKKRLCWVVKPEILIKKGLENLSFKNEWKYILNPKKHKLKQKQETESAQESSSNETIDKDVDKVESLARKKLLISNFLKKSPVDEIETSAVITID